MLEQHGPAAHALLLRVTLRADVAEELMQELFLKLGSRGSLAGVRDVGAYVRRTAIHLAMDWRRRGRRREAVSLDREIPDARADAPLRVIDDADDVERILDAAASELSELERDAFILRYVQQESFEQIGIVIGKTAHQARGLCHAAVVRIRQRLGATGAKQEVAP
jgi:RNA polymerase sigma factor (sigma-70 family)